MSLPVITGAVLSGVCKGAGVFQRYPGDWAMVCVAITNGYMAYDLISMVRLGLFRYPLQSVSGREVVGRSPVSYVTSRGRRFVHCLLFIDTRSAGLPKSPNVNLLLQARIHHVIIMVCFCLALQHDTTPGQSIMYTTIQSLALVCEIGNAFLGLHKMVRWTGVDIAKSTLAISLDVVFVIMFLFARMVLHTFVMYRLWELRDLVPSFDLAVSLGPMLLIQVLNLVLWNDFYTSRKEIYGLGTKGPAKQD